MPIIKNICGGERGAYLAGALVMVPPAYDFDERGRRRKPGLPVPS